MRTQRIADRAKKDAVIIANGGMPFLDPVFWYVTEQRSGSFEGSMAIIFRDGSLDVITGRLEETTARSGNGNVHVYERREERREILEGLLKGCRRIGISGGSVTYNFSEYIKNITNAKLFDVSKEIADVTAVKDDKEIAEIREACRISSRTARAIPDILQEGMTEKEAAWLIDSRMRADGGDGNAFETIAAFGPNAAEPHHRPSGRTLGRGDTALFDFGSRYGMYCSDLTRTVFLGRPDDILIRAYETVKRAQEAGMEKMRAGGRAKSADLAARKVIDGSEFRGRFIHSFGHGLGMNAHEGPSVSHLSKDVFKEGMIVTAEPGIYIPGVGGIRIEDTILITNDGAERLTDFDKEMTVI
ncbi:MAG: aminopeptidase P family protein [Methanomassiliicoccaceae archaeon]|nr:aminopeptidase P family protein [Methanomassiliicoccaceae archaeon]